MITRKRWR